jgi:hypothetical protein
MGLAGCGDDEDAPCEVDEDCGAEEFCIGLQGARECEQLCESDAECNRDGEVCIEVEDITRNGVTVCEPGNLQEDCQSDSDCDTANGEQCIENFCQVPAECSDSTPCANGETCQGGVCVADATTSECTGTADCLSGGETAYCADLGAGSACLDVSCGADLNSCSRCALGPNNGDRDSNGPVIFFPEQSGACVQNPNECLPGAAPWSCTFTFVAFGEDLATSNLNNRITVISRTGSRNTVFGTRSAASGANTQYTFKACFPDTTNGGIGTAVVLVDNGGADSNTLCIEGNLPR